MTRHSLKRLKKDLLYIRKRFRETEKYRLETEATRLLRSIPRKKVLFSDEQPLIFSLITKKSELSEEELISLISPYAEGMRNSDFSALEWELRCFYLLGAVDSAEAENAYFNIGDINIREINDRLNPMHINFMLDRTYELSTPSTRDIIRGKAEEIAAETGIPEERLCREYLRTAEKNDISVCEAVWNDYSRVFPRISTVKYISVITAVTVLVCLITALSTNFWAGSALYIPVFGAVKLLTDRFLSGRAEAAHIPSFVMSETEKYKTVCVLSVLASSPESITDGVNRLKEAKLRNSQKNLRFCLLCDLPPSKSREETADDEILSAVKDDEDVVVMVRNRDFSKTQDMYQGKERKRGAIDDLIRFINGEKMTFRLISGDADDLKYAPFICALDYDTLPFMDTINALVSGAIHPINKNYGIIAPRITSSLSSSSKTGLSRLWGGNGGCSNISAYDSADNELYYSVFGEGTFTGKGLIRTGAYYENLKNAFPDERILSHDILEGGILGTLYCGEVEFNDSFPPTTKGYFRRNHRWLRGDFQNVRFISDKRFSLLTKFKLSDNIRRGLEPIYVTVVLFISAVNGFFIPALLAVSAEILPFFISLASSVIQGFGFGNTREFYSPFLSLSRSLVLRLFGEVVFLMKNAWLSVDALFRTAYRLITGRRLLEWQTASALDSISAIGYGSFIVPFLLSLSLFFVSVVNNNLFTSVIALFTVFSPVAALCLDKVIKQGNISVKEKQKEQLLSEAEKLWRFFGDYTTEAENFLPPDNVQYTPVYRIAHRTSPTNIGMYLLSCVSACELGIIDCETAVTCIKNTVETVERLKKYKGNLYNWYDTLTLEPLGDFVSSVDSGNLLCCMVAVKEWVRDINHSLYERLNDLTYSADLSVFYNTARQLFSTGINVKDEKLTKNCYDMLMSEARMLSYFAISSGQVPKKHWRALSRTMSKSGKYAGPVAWTGTMFEFFMPELLLDSKKGSLSYEALNFAVHCQKERGRKKHLPFGISESAYFSFDRDLNYLYKAHGVQTLALCGGMNKEYVISPYSTFIALSHSFNACMNNLNRLSQPEFVHPKYGCYEAIDMTPGRTGGNEGVVKSHMSHHVGMSMGGIANALLDGKLRKLFLSDPVMRRGSELLEERIMIGERIMNIEKIRDKKLTPFTEESSVFSVMRPEMNLIANRRLSLFITDTGLYYGRYLHRSTMAKSPDYLRRPKGMFFGIADGEREIPFFLSAYDKGGSYERSVTFGENSGEYYVNSPSLRSGMKVSLYGENAAEIREFALENISGQDKTVSLTAYLEPCLMDDRAYNAHPMFADLFLKLEYEPKENVVIAHRKDRDSDHEIYMCMGFKEAAMFNYSFSREDVNSYGQPLEFISESGKGENNENYVPCPCVFIDLPVKIGAGQKYNTEMFVCYGESRNEVLGICHDIRSGKEEREPVSPLPKTTLQGRISRKILTTLIYNNVLSEEIINAGTSLNKTALHRFGLRDDIPLLLYKYDKDDLNLESTILTMGGLSDCQLEAQLAVICHNKGEQEKISALLNDNNKNGTVIIESSLSGEEMGLLLKSASFVFGKTSVKKAPEKLYDIIPCQIKKTKESVGFFEDKYVIDGKGHPWCNVLASRQFGCVLSQNSLGFSYAVNSRENKLTPWYNDVMNDNSGEMLLLKGNGEYYDIVGGARTVFSPDKADYYGKIKAYETHTAVRVFQKGMGKEITVEIKNTSAYEKLCSISYYTEPVLGAEKCGYMLTYRAEKDGIIVKNQSNVSYKGEMMIYCDRETEKTTDREQFLAGHTKGDIRAYGQSCAALTAKIRIKPDSTETVRFIMCFSSTDSRKMAKALKNVGTEWEKENSPVLNSPNADLNKLYNYWLPWQITGGRMWARSGFYQNGGAFGFRDQLQDGMGAVYFMPAETKRQILRCCASQFTEGDVLHWWHRTNHVRKGVRTTCSDDLLWLPVATAHYVKITGDRNILKLNAHYIEGESLGSHTEKYIEVKNTDVRENVYMHCKKALEKGFKKGSKGLLQIGCGDWNDGYNRVGIDGRGESVWLSMFYLLAVKEFASLARDMGEDEYAGELEKRGAELNTAITENAYENGYFLRAFYDDGKKMGSPDSDCCKIDLLPQAFSVLSDIPDKEKRDSALIHAYESLVDEKSGIIKLFTPAFTTNCPDDPGYVKSYPEGVRENGGQYTHGAIWLALAFLRNGDKQKAKKLTEMLSPINRGEAYKNEPYYMSADVYTNPLAYGRGGWSIYTGSAAWYYMLLGEMFGKEK